MVDLHLIDENVYQTDAKMIRSRKRKRKSTSRKRKGDNSVEPSSSYVASAIASSSTLKHDLHSLDENASQIETKSITSRKRQTKAKYQKHNRGCKSSCNFKNDASAIASSSTPSTSNFKNDVFLSFRGEDTRYTFTGHLYAALQEKKIRTFIDNDLLRGEEISPSLLKEIEASKISVVIFSQNYATSKWCLEELEKIVECKRHNRQIVFPVFYHVDPSDVRNQRGSFKEAFAAHKKSASVTKEQVKRWEGALKEVANLSGWHLTHKTLDAKFIKKITKGIWKKLNKLTSSYLDKGLIGMESRLQEIEPLLELNSCGVKCVGIWGMGGLGKTTLARAIFDKISSQFEVCFFLPNTREQLQTRPLAKLQEELFSTLLDDTSLATSTLNLSLPFIKDRLCPKKVLIVVDDVDNSTKLQELLVGRDPRFFGSGSRILVTSRDRQVLTSICRDAIYKMEQFNVKEATQLFSLNAFEQNSVPSSYVCESTKTVIDYAQGNPLALIVLGRRLFRKSEEDWRSALRSLRQIPVY